MCPPLAFITALILLCMEFTSALIFLIGMFSHSSGNAVSNCLRVLGVFRRLLTRLSSSSHKCSIGDKSGLYGGQSSGTRGYQKVLSLTWKEPEIWIYSALFFNVVPFQLHTLVPSSFPVINTRSVEVNILVP